MKTTLTPGLLIQTARTGRISPAQSAELLSFVDKASARFLEALAIETRLTVGEVRTNLKKACGQYREEKALVGTH